MGNIACISEDAADDFEYPYVPRSKYYEPEECSEATDTSSFDTPLRHSYQPKRPFRSVARRKNIQTIIVDEEGNALSTNSSCCDSPTGAELVATASMMFYINATAPYKYESPLRHSPRNDKKDVCCSTQQHRKCDV